MLEYYSQIIKQAWNLAKGYRIFWLSGLFLIWPNIFRATFIVTAATTTGGYMATVNIVGPTANESNVWLGLFGLMLFGFLVFAFYKAKSTLILSVKKLKNQSYIGWKNVYQQSVGQIAGLMKFSWSGWLVFALLVVVYTGPVTYLLDREYSDRAMILMVIGAFVFVPLLWFTYSAVILVPLFRTLFNMTVKNSLLASLDLAYKNWVVLIGFMLVLAIFELGVLGGVVGVVLLADVLFVFLGQIFYNAGGNGLVFGLQVLVGSAIFILFLVSQVFVASFQKIAWAVLFMDIVRPVSAPDEQSELAESEVVS